MMMNRCHLWIAACVASASCLVGGMSIAASSCDRGCLSSLADRYLTDLGRHDPQAAPLAPGEGLWIGASSDPIDFKIPVIDEVAGQIGLFAVLKENGRPVIVIVR